MDIRPTSEQALEYIWFGRQCLDLARRSGRTGAKAFQDGRLLVICKYTLHHATLITLSQGDFTMHPRSGPLRSYPVTDDITIPGINGGGYIQSGNAFAEMSSRLPYPLVDNDHGTFIINIDGEDLEVEWAEAGDENYGNLWWFGTGDDPPVLSWKGPPSVQFGLPASAAISGLTQTISGVSTPFNCFIYQDGARLCRGPQPIPDNKLATLIVGACYATDEDAKQWLIAVCITKRDSRYFLQVWRSEDRGAEWELVEEFLSVRASSPAFIHRSGKVFIYAGVRYIISENLKYVLRPNEQMPASEKGIRTITGRGGYGSTYEFSDGVGYCWPAIDPNGELVFSEYTESASFTGTGNGDTQNQVVQVPVYRGNPATDVTIMAGYNGGFVFDAVFKGSYCSVQWSGVDRYKGTRAWKAAPKGCNTSFTVSVTLMPQGVSATYTHDTAALGAMVISGPTDRVASGQYTVANAVGAVTWTNSKGTISSSGAAIFSGCGTATITATDACGRTATISVSLPTGVWRLVESWRPGIATYNWFTYPAGGNASKGGSYVSGGYETYSNQTNVAGLQWNAIKLKCVSGSNPKELGPLSGDLYRTPPGMSQIASTHVSTDNHCYSVTLYRYYRMTYYDKYEWKCSTDVLVSTVTDGYYTYYTYAAA